MQPPPSPLFLLRVAALMTGSLTALTALAVLTSARPCEAQVPVPVPAPDAAPIAAATDTMPRGTFGASFLSRLRDAEWDAAVRGPLLVVVPTPFVSEWLPPRRVTLHAIGTAAGMRLEAAGRTTTLIPRTIQVINTRPGKANPFLGLTPGETLPLLLVSLNPAQWQQILGPGGIGAGDLTDDQRLLWKQMLPNEATVQKNTTTRTGASVPQRVETVYTSTRPRAAGRLRLNKTLDFSFYKVGATDAFGSGGLHRFTGSQEGVRYYLSNLSVGRNETLPNSAYGVQLITPQPARVKPGAIDFAAPSLDALVLLSDFPRRVVAKKAGAEQGLPPALQAEYATAEAERLTLPTIGDLLLRISKATRLEFVADRRVRDLPVYLRGDSPRAGDLLLALCGSVGGAFRKIEPGGKEDAAPLYLLTDDVDGIGTRAGHLAEWGEAAHMLKRRMMEGAAKNDPLSLRSALSLLTFAPDDDLALPAAQIKRLEDGGRSGKGSPGTDVFSADWTPALREAVRKFADEQLDEGVPIDTGRVRVRQTLKAFLLLPEMNGVAIEVEEMRNVPGVIGGIRATSARDSDSAAAAAPAPAVGFTDPKLKRQRRVLIARPGTAAEATSIVRTAAGRGIGEVWLETSLADPQAAVGLLTAAAKAAKAAKAGGTKVAVGAVVRLLKGGGLPGEVDRNILGETGEEYVARRNGNGTTGTDEERYPDSYRPNLSGFAGWTILRREDAAEMRRRVSVIAAVPGLASLTFRATGGPGWTGRKWSSSLWTNTALGYTPSMRRAFLRESGIDPLDIPDTEWQLRDVNWNLGYFHTLSEAPRMAWWEFRQRRNTAMLAALFEAVRKEKPALPLHLEDRNSGFLTPSIGWFGSWDAARRLPETAAYASESGMRSDARRTSKVILAHWSDWGEWGERWRVEDAANLDSPAAFARKATTSALRFPPPAWDGLVIDLSGVPGTAVAALLTGLSEVR